VIEGDGRGRGGITLRLQQLHGVARDIVCEIQQRKRVAG